MCKPEAFELSLGGLSLEIDNYELNVDGFEWQAWHVALAAVLGVLAGAALVLCVLRGLLRTKARGMTPQVGGASGTGARRWSFKLKRAGRSPRHRSPHLHQAIDDWRSADVP